MALNIWQFEHVAEIVAEQAAELLGTRVWVTDQHSAVIACKDAVYAPGDIPGNIRHLMDYNGGGETYVRVPMRVGTTDGEVIVAEPAGSDDGITISPRLAQALVELMIRQTVITAQLPNRQELKNKFIHDLLRGRIKDEADTLREGQMLGMDLTLPRAAILIDAADYVLAAEDRTHAIESRIPRRAQFVIASIVGFFNLPNDTICAYIGDGEIAVLKASSTQDLVAWTDDPTSDQGSASWANLVALKRAANALITRLQHDTHASINIGIGRYHPGITGMARSYEDARAALSLGRRFQRGNHVHCLDGLGVAAFVGVSDERTKIDLATHLLSPLDQEPELVETLNAFFAEDCSPSATSSRLCIHRNTLSYRLEKISSLTGLDPRRFDDAVQIRVALVLRSLQTCAA